MAERDAVSTILGYFYQFDRTIQSILGLAQDGESVAVECIEDIDIHTATEATAVQCKYYAKSEYNHSVIKPAIEFMLAHYKKGLADEKPLIKYQLCGHFSQGQDKLVLPIDIEFLKENFLTTSKKATSKKKAEIIKKHEILGVTDAELNDFLLRLTIDLHAPEFEKQFQSVIDTLVKQFSCSKFVAEFYYNNALRVIKDLSTSHDPKMRTVTKAEFIKQIDASRNLLFDEWSVVRRGKKAYFADLRKRFFSASVNLQPAHRLFVVHIAPGTYQRIDAKSLLQEISRKYAQISPRAKSKFSPYVLIQGIDPAELAGLKRELKDEQVSFIDGYDFKDAEFDSGSISRNATADGPELRIFGDAHQAQETFTSVRVRREIYEFYVSEPLEHFGSAAIKHITLQIPDYQDISKII